MNRYIVYISSLLLSLILESKRTFDPHNCVLHNLNIMRHKYNYSCKFFF